MSDPTREGVAATDFCFTTSDGCNHPLCSGKSECIGRFARTDLLTLDESEIKLVPAASRDVWTKPAGRTYTREDYERDKAAREARNAGS